MDLITRSPGLHHILEAIFMNLDEKNLHRCEEVNKICKDIVRNKSLIWYKKLIQRSTLSQRAKTEWMKLIDKLRDSNQIEFMKSYFKKLGFRKSLQERIYEAVEAGNVKFIKRVAENNIVQLMDNPNASHPDFGWTPIQKATVLAAERNGRPEYAEIIQILAPLSENPNAPFVYNGRNAHLGPTGWTPIHHSADKGIVKVVRILAPLCVNPNEPDVKGRTPIHHAAKNGHAEVIEILLQVQFTNDPNTPDLDGRTPMHLALNFGHRDVIEILLPFIDNPNVPDSRGFTPIQIASSKGYVDIIGRFLPYTDNPNAPDPTGRTPIQRAAKRGDIDVLKLFLNFTENPNDAPDPRRLTPIQTAAKHGHLDVIKLMAPKTYNINAPGPNGTTPLVWASKNGHTDVQEFLIQVLSVHDHLKQAISTIDSLSKAKTNDQNIDRQELEELEDDYSDNELEDDYYHNYDNEGLLNCSFCDKDFMDILSLTDHVEKNHQFDSNV